MEQTVWNVYKQFRCIAQRCPDSCCKDWEVDIDEQTASFYQTLEGPLGEDLRQVLKTEDGEASMVLQQSRCPMWRSDGLCRIQAEKGHDALCKVCREYPRLHQDYGDFQEWGLELSCPEAARLIFQDTDVTTKAVPETGTAEYDVQTMDILKRSRGEVLHFLQTTGLTVPQMLAVLLLYSYQVQDALDGGDYVSLDEKQCLAAAQRYAGTSDLGLLLSFFQELEILTDRWRLRLRQPQQGTWEPALRALAVYFVRRYWLQAVWDFDLTCRVKLAVAGCILVNGLGGDPVETAQLFSKEIENDPDNVEAILDSAYTTAALTDANLLGLLLNDANA